MKKFTLLAILIFFSITTNSFSQNSEITYGIKAGANYSKFIYDFKGDGLELAPYQRKVGFYAGAFLNIGISEKLQFQPEFLLALQGSGVLIEDIEVTGGSQNPTVSDFESNINEWAIELPLVFRYFFTKAFFMDGGPQLGFIVSRNEKIKKDPLGLPGESYETNFDHDKFDLGLTVGAGYNLTKDIALNSRFFLGLIKRDNTIKPSIFNLGLEYKL